MTYHHRQQAFFGSGFWSATEDRDVSRAAAERYFLLQSLPEPRRAVHGQRSRRFKLPAFASRARRAAA